MWDDQTTPHRPVTPQWRVTLGAPPPLVDSGDSTPRTGAPVLGTHTVRHRTAFEFWSEVLPCRTSCHATSADSAEPRNPLRELPTMSMFNPIDGPWPLTNDSTTTLVDNAALLASRERALTCSV